MVVLYIYCFLTASWFQEESHQVDVKMSNDDVLGDEIPPDQEEGYRQFFYRMLSLNIGVCNLKSCIRMFTQDIM